jgi:hypothetical protein
MYLAEKDRNIIADRNSTVNMKGILFIFMETPLHS